MEAHPLTILLVEDNPGDARLVQELLREVTSIQFRLEQVDCLSQGLLRLSQQRFDVVLLDLSLPDSQDLETFVRLNSQVRDVPIVVITGLNDETLAVRAVQEGAQDYLVKGQLSSALLVRSIRYAIERKRTELKIREQAALLDIATDAILVWDLESLILFWNQGAERIYGWKAEAAIGQKSSELLFRSPSAPFQNAQLQEGFQDAQAHLMATGEWYGELEQVTQAGKAIVVESRWTLMRGQQGQPKSLLVVNTDITEKKQLEAQFLRIQRMESIGTLASGIAHDLNNILTPILATAQLLKMKLTDMDDQTLQLLEIAEVNTRRGAALVKQVLSFARGVEGKHTVLQLKHLIREIQQIVRETFPKSIEVYSDIPSDLWTIAGNATQLHQVLMNLCVNARDAMPDGGLLSLSAKNLLVDDAYARINLEAKTGAYIVVMISDTGMGISSEVLDRIFEPFFTTKEVGKGTGLGLSTAIGIVKSHGGFINVTSSVGNGTQFKVFLPAVNAIAPPEEETPETPSGQGELILVVDDEAAIREVNQATLEAYRYRVITANDGIEAITLYLQQKDSISLVLIDMMMPAMDGATAIHALQKINPQVKVIATSGLVPHPHPVTNPPPSIQAFLSKPYTATELVQTVNDVIKAFPIVP